MISSTCSIRWRLSPRPDPTFSFAAERSDGQGWPKAIAKRLALDGREHSGRLVGLGRPIPVAVSFRTCFVARFNVANYDDTEGSSPSGASIAPQTCIRSIREDRNHDAVMRIGGEAPRRRALSKPRLEDHVQYRVPVTVDVEYLLPELNVPRRPGLSVFKHLPHPR